MLVHQVVLAGGVVQVGSGVAVSTVLAHDGLQVVHGEELLVLVGGGVEEHAEVHVNHFVVAHEEGGGGEVRLVHVVLLILILV